MESRECCYIQRPGLPGFDKLAENDALWSVESFPLVEQILLDYLVRSLHVNSSSQRPGDRVEIESEMSGQNGVLGDTRAYDFRHIKPPIVWNHCGEGERDAKT